MRDDPPNVFKITDYKKVSCVPTPTPPSPVSKLICSPWGKVAIGLDLIVKRAQLQSTTLTFFTLIDECVASFKSPIER